MAAEKIDEWSGNTGQNTLSRTVSNGNNRVMVVCIHTRESGGVIADVSSVDYGGQAMTKLIDVDTPGGGNRINLEVWYILEDGIDARTNDTITPTFSTAPNQHSMAAAVFAKVKQGNPFSESHSDSANASTPNPFTTIDIDGNVGDIPVGVVACQPNTTTTWQADLTERIDQTDVGSTMSVADGAVITTAGNVTVEGTFASQTRACAISFEVNAKPLPQYAKALSLWIRTNPQAAAQYGNPSKADLDATLAGLLDYFLENRDVTGGWKEAFTGTALNNLTNKDENQLFMRLLAQRLYESESDK